MNVSFREEAKKVPSLVVRLLRGGGAFAASIRMCDEIYIVFLLSLLNHNLFLSI